MKMTKTQLRRIIKEELENVLNEGREELQAIELQAIANKVQKIPNDPELQKAFKNKYARHANKAMGKELDDPWGLGWVNTVMVGGF